MSVGPGRCADRAEVAARGAEEGGPRCGQRPQGGGILLGERPDDAGAVGEQRLAAFVGGPLAGEQEQAGWVRQAGPVGVRDQFGVGECRVASSAGPGIGDHGDAVRSGVAVRPNLHQPPCHGGQHGAVGDAAEGRPAPRSRSCAAMRGC